MKKSYIILFYLFIFTAFLSLYEINLKILKQKQIEYLYRTYLINFSYIESEVLIQTIDKFYRYKMDDFVYESELGDIYIYFLDEIAYIEYRFESIIFAKLDYDLIYNSCVNYEIISEALFPVVDKLNS